MSKQNNRFKKITELWKLESQKRQSSQQNIPDASRTDEQPLNARPDTRRRGRPSNSDIGKETNYVRTSLMIDKALYRKIRTIAVVNSLAISDICNGALSEYLAAYEQKHGTVVPFPEKAASAGELI